MLPFPQVAKEFRLIEEERCSVLIPWDERAEQIRLDLLRGKVNRQLVRRAGRYLVGVRPAVFNRLLQEGKAVKATEKFAVAKGLEGIYSPETGLLCREEPRTVATEKGV